MNTKTFSARAQNVQRRWYVIDAAGKVVGRVAERAARLLRGKDRVIFTPHVDTGDFVIVINAKKAVFTGKKEMQKEYMSFSGYMGGHKSENVARRRQRRPELLIEQAIKGMIPHNRLGAQILKKLRVYADGEHEHQAQNPELVVLS